MLSNLLNKHLGQLNLGTWMLGRLETSSRRIHHNAPPDIQSHPRCAIDDVLARKCQHLTNAQLAVRDEKDRQAHALGQVIGNLDDLLDSEVPSAGAVNHRPSLSRDQ